VTTYADTELLLLDLPDNIPPNMPYVFDDTSLAFSLGIRCKTLWWLLVSNTAKKIERDQGLYTSHRIPKRGGSKGYREIDAPCAALKNVQRALLVTYFNHLVTPTHIGAYTRGRSLHHTAEKHVQKAVKISLDIKDFFPSTRRSWVRDWLRTFGYGEWVVGALSNLMVIPKKRGGKVYSCLPQGAPTSGLVANFVANARIDVPLMAYLHGLDTPAVYTRYSDNIEVSFDKDLSREDVDQITGRLTRLIHDSGYRVNRNKTRIQRQTSPTQSMSVLGMTVNEKLNIPAEKYRRLRAIVHNCAARGFSSQLERAKKETKMALYAHIHGKLIYWAQVNPAKIKPLLVQFKEAAITQNIME